MASDVWPTRKTRIVCVGGTRASSSFEQSQIVASPHPAPYRGLLKSTAKHGSLERPAHRENAAKAVDRAALRCESSTSFADLGWHPSLPMGPAVPAPVTPVWTAAVIGIEGSIAVAVAVISRRIAVAITVIWSSVIAVIRRGQRATDDRSRGKPHPHASPPPASAPAPLRLGRAGQRDNSSSHEGRCQRRGP